MLFKPNQYILNVLQEGESFWGVDTAGRGQNKMGIALMHLRDRLGERGESKLPPVAALCQFTHQPAVFQVGVAMLLACRRYLQVTTQYTFTASESRIKSLLTLRNTQSDTTARDIRQGSTCSKP